MDIVRRGGPLKPKRRSSIYRWIPQSGSVAPPKSLKRPHCTGALSLEFLKLRSCSANADASYSLTASAAAAIAADVVVRRRIA